MLLRDVTLRSERDSGEPNLSEPNSGEPNLSELTDLGEPTGSLLPQMGQPLFSAEAGPLTEVSRQARTVKAIRMPSNVAPTSWWVTVSGST